MFFDFVYMSIKLLKTSLISIYKKAAEEFFGSFAALYVLVLYRKCCFYFVNKIEFFPSKSFNF